MFKEMAVVRQNYKRKIPDPVVYRAGTYYQSASEVLFRSEGNLYVAVINASLAIEIYLKSFLVKEHAVNGYKMHKKTEHGHDLLKLFKRIHQSDRVALKETIKEINPTIDIEAKLSQYKNIFTDARYMFEPVKVESIGSDVILFSRILKEAVSKIYEIRYPVNVPENVKKAVDLYSAKNEHNANP